jgi:hypothetical protein
LAVRAVVFARWETLLALALTRGGAVEDGAAATAARRAVGLVAWRGRDEPVGGGIEVMTTNEKGYTTDLKTTGIASTESDDEV